VEKRSSLLPLSVEVMQAGEEPVKIDLRLNIAAPKGSILQVLLLVDRPHMAQDVLVGLAGVPPAAVGDHRMHAELRVLVLVDQVRPHGGGDYIGHLRVPLGEVCRKIHLLPSVLLLDLLHAGEAEVLPHAPPLHEVYQPICIGHSLLTGSE